MFEKLVADIIAKYIGEYIKNISSEQLKINVFSGNAVLNNLEIKGEALQSFKLPLHVQKGIIGTLKLKIPWTNIKSSPVIIEIDSISLYAIPQTGFDYNEEEEKRKQIEYKKKKLDKFELIRSFKEGNGNEQKSSKQDSFMASVMSKILNNIQVKIQNFHLRYEEIRGGKVYSLGISFGSLTAHPTDNNWQTMNASDNSNNNNNNNSLFKYIELTNFSIYLNSENKEEASIKSIVEKNDNQLFIDKLNSMIGTQDSLGNHQYILKPITVRLKIELNRNLNMDLDVPRMRIYCKFDQISFVIEENQYQTILKLLTTIGNYAQEIKYLHYRPKQRPKQDPRGWWRYVGEVIRESIREKIQKRSWNFIQKRRQNRKEYVLLFKKLQNVDWLEPITEKELKQLSEMEEHLSFEDIIYFRSLARRELAMETEIADQKKGEFYANVKRNASKSWWSWGSATAASNETPRFSIQLSKEQQDEILKSMEYDEIALSATIEMPPHYISNIIEVQIDAVIFTVIGSRIGEDPLIKSYLNNINFKLSQRETGFKLELDLESFNVLDNNKNNSLFSYVVTSNPKYKRIKSIDDSDSNNSDNNSNNSNDNNSNDNNDNNTILVNNSNQKLNNNLFHIIFESKPINSSYDYALSLVLKSLEIIINKQQIERLVEFATPKESVNLFSLSSAALEEFILLKEMTIFQLREVVNHHKTIDLFIDAKAPILIIPEHYSNQDIRDDTNLIILDLGNFLMQSDLSKKPRKTISMETPFIINEQVTKLIDQQPDGEEEDNQDIEKDNNNKQLIKNNSNDNVSNNNIINDEEEENLKVSDLYDHYRASLSSIKVLLATHKQDWYSPDENNSKGYQLIEEMSINLHIQSCIEPNELSLTMFKVSGILPQVKMNISDNSYLRLYRMAKTLSRIHSKTTTTTITAYNHFKDIYSNTQDTFVQQVDATSTEIKLSDAYKQVLSKRKIFDASFKLEKVLINISSLKSGNTIINNSNNGSSLLQLRISNLQVSLKKRTYDYKGHLLLGSFEVEDCQETSEKFSCLITSQSRFINNNQQSSSTSSLPPNTNKLITIDTDIIDKESPNYQQVDTLVDFSFGELNFNYNPKSIGKILCFLDYCFEETFNLKEQFINNNSNSSSISLATSLSSTPLPNSSPLLISSNSNNSNELQQQILNQKLLQQSQSLQQQQQLIINGNNSNSIIKAKASIYSLSISLNEDGKELGRFSINEFAIDECKISGRSLEISGRLESITIDSFLDHPTEGFKILTPKDSGVSMAKFKYCTFNQNNQVNQNNKNPQIQPINQFDKEIELYLKSIRLTVLVDFILKTKHLIELPFKTVKYDSLYRYQQQQIEEELNKQEQNNQQLSPDESSTTTSTLSKSISIENISSSSILQPIGFKPQKINYKVFLESPQVILSSSDDIHSDHDRIIAELGSIDVKTTIIRNREKLLSTNGQFGEEREEEINVDWESIEANLCDMNIKTFKNGVYHQVLHNLSIYNKIETILCDEYGKYVPFQRIPQQKKINVDIKEIKVEFIDLEHSLILSLTKDVINRITSKFIGNESSSSLSSSKSSRNQSKSNSLSNSNKLLPPLPTLSPTKLNGSGNNILSNSTSNLNIINNDKKYCINLINLNISSFQLIMKLSECTSDSNDINFSTIKIENISLNSESCERSTVSTMNLTIGDLILYDDRVTNGFNKLIEKQDVQSKLPLVKVEILNFKEKNQDNQIWDNSISVEVQPVNFVLSLGLILGIKDFFLLPFVTTLTCDQLKDYNPNSIEIPSLSSVVESLGPQSKLGLSVIAHSPKVILPISNHSSKVLVFDIKGGVNLTNTFTSLFVESALTSFDYEQMFIKLNQAEFNICNLTKIKEISDQEYNYNLEFLETISNDQLNVNVNFSSWDSIFINTIELLTSGKQPTEVDVVIDNLSFVVTELQYQLFCDMLAHLLRTLDDSPKLKLKKLNPYMFNVLLDKLNQISDSNGINQNYNNVLDIFGMKVLCKFNKVLINLLSNDNKSIEFSKLVLDNVDISIDMATENRPKKMLIKGTVDELNVYDLRGDLKNKPFNILERYNKSLPMMEFSQLMYQFNSSSFPKNQIYSSILDFKLNNIKTYAFPSFALRVWDWVVLSITSVFGSYQYDKYDGGFDSTEEREQHLVFEKLQQHSKGQNNRMKMNVAISNPIIILPSDQDKGVQVEVKPKEIQIYNEFLLKSNCLGLIDYQDIINISLNSIDINLLTHDGITESSLLYNSSNLLVSLETIYSISDLNSFGGHDEECSALLSTNKFTIKSPALEFKFDQIQYNHFYHCVNNALKHHYEMDSIENEIYLKPNFNPKSNDMITSIILDSISLKLLDQDQFEDDDIDKIHSEIIISNLSLENILNSKEETMQVIGLLGNLKVIDSINQIVILEPIASNSDRFFTMFKYKTFGNGAGYKDPLQWDTEFEFSMKSVQCNLSLPNINVPISIQSFLLSVLEKYPISTRPTKLINNSGGQNNDKLKPKMKLDINLLYSKIVVSPYPNSLAINNIDNNIGSIKSSTGILSSSTGILSSSTGMLSPSNGIKSSTGISLLSSSLTNLSPYDYMVISFNTVSMKHQPNQIDKLDDSDLLELDIENINYKISSLQVEIILSQKKPYFLLTDIDVDIKQKTIRNHDQIINKIQWENNPLDRLNDDDNNQENNNIGSKVNESQGEEEDDTENYSKLFNDDILLLSRSKTSIHSNASQIDLNSNHFEFLWNLYQSIGKINQQQEEFIINNDNSNNKSTTSTSTSTSTTATSIKDKLLNMIEFKLKDIKVNLINEFNKPILNISLKQLETYLCQYESDNNSIFKIIGSIKSLEAKDIRRESLLNSKYQNLFGDHSNTLQNSIQFTYKPWKLKTKEELFNESRDGLRNNSNPDAPGKWDQHLNITIKNSQIIPIFDLFTDIQSHFLPSSLINSNNNNIVESSSTSTSSPKIKIDLVLELNSIILPMNFEISNYYIRNDIKRIMISNDYEVRQIEDISTNIHHSIESSIYLIDINGFTMESVMDVIMDAPGEPRQSRIIRDSNIFIVSKMLNLPTSSFKKPINISNMETSIDIESLDFLFCLEEYKFMYDTLNSTLKRYYDFKFLPTLSKSPPYKPNEECEEYELLSLDNKTKLIINSLVLNMLKRQKPNCKENLNQTKPIGQVTLRRLVMDIDMCKLNLKMVGSISSCFIRSIRDPNGNNIKSLYMDIMKPKYNFDSSSDDDAMIKFEYVSHSEPVAIVGDKSPLKVLWDTQYSVDISNITLVSKIATLLKIKDFIMDPLQTPFVQPPSNKPPKDSNYKPKMYQVLTMKPWTLEIPESETSQDMISIEFGQVDMKNIYRFYVDSNGFTINQPIEVLLININQFTLYTQTENGIMLNTVSNSPSLYLQVERLFTINNRSLEDIRTIAYINNLDLIFSANDYLFMYTIFTGNWMFNDLEEISIRSPDPPATPSWNGCSKFIYAPLDHCDQMKISENQFSSHKGFINIIENQVLQTFKLQIETFNFHMNPVNDPLAILIMENLSLNYTMYRDGIQKTSVELLNVLLLDERINTSCVFKEILTRKQFDSNSSFKKSSSPASNSSPFSPLSPQFNNSNNNSPRNNSINIIPPHIVIDFLMDPNHNRQFTSIKIDHPKLFVSPNSILPLLDFFSSIQPKVEIDQNKTKPLLLEDELDQQYEIQLKSKELLKENKSIIIAKPPPHTRFYLQVTKPKLLLVEDETQQNTNALVMKMPVEFHYSRTSDLNQTMELHASKCQVFRTTPFSENNNFVSTPITNSFAFNCIFIQFNANDQQTIEMRFQPLNIGLSYKEFLMIQRLINNLSFVNYKKQQQEQKEKEEKDKQDNENSSRNLSSSTSSSNLNNNDQDLPSSSSTNNLNKEEQQEVKLRYKELEKKKKEKKENSKSKSLIAPGRPDDSNKFMHKTRVHVEFLGRISFTLIDESVTMKDIPFVQMNIGEFTSDYWSWDEYSFLTCDMYFKVEVFNQKHMAFDSLVEQFQLNLQVLQSDDPKLKISLKSLSQVNVNISQPFIQALGNFYQNILKINNEISNNNSGGNTASNSNNSSLNNSLNNSINGIATGNQHLANSFSSPELIIFETNEELVLHNENITSPITNPTNIMGVKKPNSTISPRNSSSGKGHQRSVSNTIHDLNTISTPGWRKPNIIQDYLELNNNNNNISSSNKNSLSNSIISSKVRDMRSTVDLSSLNAGGAQVHRHSRQNSVTSPSLNTASLYTTESNTQFWVVNLTGKAIEYYVEDLNFIQSYNINQDQNTSTVINLNTSHLNNSFNLNNSNSINLFNSNNSISSNSSNGSSSYLPSSSNSNNNTNKTTTTTTTTTTTNNNNNDDEDDIKINKRSQYDQIKKVIRNQEKQGVELKSALFKTRDFRTHGSLNANIAIRFKESDEYPWIHNVSINQIGDNFYFPPYGNKANLVVCEVGWDEKNETKIATLRSPVMIRNSSNIPIEIRLSSSKNEEYIHGPIRVDEKYYIPVDFWNSNSSISIRPHGKDYDFDDKVLNLYESSSWPESFIFDSSKTIVDVNDGSLRNLNINDINHSSSSSNNQGGSANNSTSSLPQIKKEHMYLGALARSGIRCDRTGLITTTLVVTPPLIFENVLMCDIEIRFTTHSKRKSNDFLRNALSKPSTILTPGKQTAWYYNQSNDIGMLLSLKGLGKNQYFHLQSSIFNSPLSIANNDGNDPNSVPMNAFTQELSFQCTPEYSSISYTLNLKIDHRFEGGCHIASIYCTNAIHNHTMIPFLLRPTNIKDKLTLETNETPLLLSHDKFYLYHPSTPKVASKEFDIILGKEDIIEIFDSKSDQMRYQFKAIVSTGYNIFFRTRIVDIYPRYILINKLPISLSYTQFNKDVRVMARDSQFLEPDDSIPFHWYNGKEEQQLSVTIVHGIVSESYQYSGGIRIDQVGVNFLKLRHYHDELIEQSIKVEVRDSSESTLVIFYSNDPQNLPFHIKNESFSTIMFYQKSPGSKKYTLKPNEKIYYTWDFPSSERQLTVQIDFFGEKVEQDINLNKIKVFKPIKLPNNQTIYPIVNSSNGTTRDLLFTTHYEEKKELDLLDFAFEVSFPSLGFSLIDDIPQEMIYISFKDFNYWISSSNLTYTTWLLIDDIQIDNQQPNTEFPVLLWCDKKKDSEALPFLEYSSVKLKNKNIEYYDLIALYLNEMYCQLDDKTLLNLNNFYQKIPMEKFQDKYSVTLDEGAIPENFYIKWLIFAEIKIYLTFSISRDGILSNYNKMPALRLVVPSLGKSLGQLENAPLNINQLGIKNIFTDKSNLTQLLMSHYTKQMKRQIHVILGSSSIFGSPLVFFNNISTGMTEAIEDPIIGSIQLMKRILYAAANSSSKLFGTISNGFATWSLDEQYLRKRDAEEKVKAKHIAHGLYLGSKGFAMGIFNGVFGIVEHPIKGAMQEGAFGFLKGCGKGILGIAVKPVTGVFDFASKTSEGIRNNTNIHPERFRIRTPRFINPREPIKEYSIDESEGNFLLKKNSEDIVKNEGTLKMEYKFHVILPDCTLLLTNHSLICLSKKGIYRWSFPLSEISKLRIINTQDKCKLNIHLKNYRSFGTFSQLRKKISIHCQNDSILYQLYSKITSCFNKSNQLEIEENNEEESDKNTIAMISKNKF